MLTRLGINPRDAEDAVEKADPNATSGEDGDNIKLPILGVQKKDTCREDYNV
jgi:hypothetical protein